MWALFKSSLFGGLGRSGCVGRGVGWVEVEPGLRQGTGEGDIFSIVVIYLFLIIHLNLFYLALFFFLGMTLFDIYV